LYHQEEAVLSSSILHITKGIRLQFYCLEVPITWVASNLSVEQYPFETVDLVENGTPIDSSGFLLFM
jgi:hypothetical protein